MALAFIAKRNNAVTLELPKIGGRGLYIWCTCYVEIRRDTRQSSARRLARCLSGRWRVSERWCPSYQACFNEQSCVSEGWCLSERSCLSERGCPCASGRGGDSVDDSEDDQKERGEGDVEM